MFIIRVLFFKLYESPKWLVGAGRNQDAVLSLKEIVKFNGDKVPIELPDVIDHITIEPSLNLNDQHYGAGDTSPSPPNSATAPLYTSLPSGERPTNEDNSFSSKCTNKFYLRPVSLFSSLNAYLEHVSILFTPTFLRTTTLTWSIWFSISVGYTIFNVFLPRWLEHKIIDQIDGGRLSSLRNYVLYTVAGYV
jgi:hypothetical protein